MRPSGSTEARRQHRLNITHISFYVLHVIIYTFGIFGLVDFVAGFWGYRALQIPFLPIVAVILGLLSIGPIGSGRLNLKKSE